MKTKDPEEMEMPCSCRKCGEWFDLNDGRGSEKWFPNTVICEDCGEEEEKEIEKDEEIDDLKIAISDAEITIKDSIERLKELGVTDGDLNNLIRRTNP
jgi:peptide subunit release factor 1 (eRF1)